MLRTTLALILLAGCASPDLPTDNASWQFAWMSSRGTDDGWNVRRSKPDGTSEAATDLDFAVCPDLAPDGQLWFTVGGGTDDAPYRVVSQSPDGRLLDAEPSLTGYTDSATAGPTGTLAFDWKPTGESCSRIRVRVDGEAGSRLLTNEPHACETQPAWSPDGRSLVYVRLTDDSPEPRLYTATLEDPTPRPLFDLAGLHPSWRPDGGALAFECLAGSGLGICVSDLESGLTRRVTSGPDHKEAVWLPDGSGLLFTVVTDTDRHWIAHLDLESGAQRAVVDDRFDNAHIAVFAGTR